jgi:hypothetical protein
MYSTYKFTQDSSVDLRKKEMRRIGKEYINNSFKEFFSKVRSEEWRNIW